MNYNHEKMYRTALKKVDAIKKRNNSMTSFLAEQELENLKNCLIKSERISNRGTSAKLREKLRLLNRVKASYKRINTLSRDSNIIEYR